MKYLWSFVFFPEIKIIILKFIPINPLFCLCLGVASLVPAHAQQQPLSNPPKVLKLGQAYEWIYNETGSKIFQTLWKDLNQDDKKELLIGTGCDEYETCLYFTFLNKTEGFQYIGTLLLNRAKFKILPSQSHGINEILYFSPRQDNGGYLLRYRYNGNVFEVDSSHFSQEKNLENAEKEWSTQLKLQNSKSSPEKE